MRTETVCSEFCRVYARITGIDALASSHISASHDLHGGRPGLTVSAATLESAGSVDEGFGRSAEVSVGRLSVGVTVSEDDPLGILYDKNSESVFPPSLETYLVHEVILESQGGGVQRR
jgi:hypothetical protein